jgi:hypothetical protein
MDNFFFFCFGNFFLFFLKFLFRYQWLTSIPRSKVWIDVNEELIQIHHAKLREKQEEEKRNKQKRFEEQKYKEELAATFEVPPPITPKGGEGGEEDAHFGGVNDFENPDKYTNIFVPLSIHVGRLVRFVYTPVSRFGMH